MRETSFLENAGISACAAAISKTSAAPIERIKLLLQNQNEIIKSGKIDKPFLGIIDCASRTYRHEGFLSFWRGNLTNVIRYFPTQGLNFAFKDKIKTVFRGGYWKDKSLAKNTLSGGFGGVITNFFVYSLDFARTRLANDVKNQGTTRLYKGLTDVYLKTLKSNGIRGLYRGFSVSILTIFVYRGLYFGLYDTISPQANTESFFQLFLIGWFSTISAGMSCYPMDTIRRRMMMNSGNKEKSPTGRQVFNYIIKNEGILSFFKGGSANIFRSVAGAGVLVGVDKIKQVYLV